MIRKAKDLSADQRLVVESLLGRCLLEAESVSIEAFEPGRRFGSAASGDCRGA